MWDGRSWITTEHSLPPQEHSLVPTNWWLKTIMGDSGSGKFFIVNTNLVWGGINWDVLDTDVMYSSLMQQAEWLCTNNGHAYRPPRPLDSSP